METREICRLADFILKRKQNNLWSNSRQIDERRSGNRSSGFYAEVMRICKLFDANNSYEWCSMYYKRNRKQFFLCFYTVIETFMEV